MKCDEIREELSAYLDDELSDTLRRMVETHLETCAACRAELEGIREAARLVRDLPRISAPSNLADSVVGKLAAESRTTTPIGAFLRRFVLRRHIIWPAAAAAVALIIVLVGREPPGVAKKDQGAARELALKESPELLDADKSTSLTFVSGKPAMLADASEQQEEIVLKVTEIGPAVSLLMAVLNRHEAAIAAGQAEASILDSNSYKADYQRSREASAGDDGEGASGFGEIGASPTEKNAPVIADFEILVPRARLAALKQDLAATLSKSPTAAINNEPPATTASAPALKVGSQPLTSAAETSRDAAAAGAVAGDAQREIMASAPASLPTAQSSNPSAQPPTTEPPPDKKSEALTTGTDAAPSEFVRLRVILKQETQAPAP